MTTKKGRPLKGQERKKVYAITLDPQVVPTIRESYKGFNLSEEIESYLKLKYNHIFEK